MGEVKTHLSVLQTKLHSIQKYSDKQDDRIDDLNRQYNKRHTDPNHRPEDNHE